MASPLAGNVAAGQHELLDMRRQMAGLEDALAKTKERCEVAETELAIVASRAEVAETELAIVASLSPAQLTAALRSRGVVIPARVGGRLPAHGAGGSQ